MEENNMAQTGIEELTEPQTTSLAKEENNTVEEEDRTKDINARFARERREREQHERLCKAEKQGELNAIKKVVGNNPYTGKPIENEEDIADLMEMQEIERKGGNPLEEMAEREKNAERLSNNKLPEEKWYKKDASLFAKEFPDVDKKELFADEIFRDFALKSIGILPMSTIYRNYIALKDRIIAEATKQAEEKIAFSFARNSATPGSLSGEQGGEELFSKEQIKEMSVADIERNYDRVLRSIKNRK